MSSGVNSNIETLNRENYDTWKMQMKAILIKDDLWEYANGTINNPKQRMKPLYGKKGCHVDKLKEMGIEIADDLLSILLLYSVLKHMKTLDVRSNRGTNCLAQMHSGQNY
ncbi:uncharacterized protein LOC117151552 [Bombus impatiens]|uniref:Uncharacterized protein LOC117151552 n=1 Tax=Bombus impatiens TaxID=132113 RepID=A0A6P8LRW7_BOMIM|nr:uncharacterized protein LOC117151552 [Bombus impatiens]